MTIIQDDCEELPLVEDLTVKEALAEFCTGLNFVHGNLHMTFASVTADDSASDALSKRIVSARIVMPIIGAIELRDFACPAHRCAHRAGVIIPETPSPTVVTPRVRPH